MDQISDGKNDTTGRLNVASHIQTFFCSIYINDVPFIINIINIDHLKASLLLGYTQFYKLIRQPRFLLKFISALSTNLSLAVHNSYFAYT